MSKVEAVLDASAFLALVHGEKGGDVVRSFCLRGGMVMSTVNYCETVANIVDHGIHHEIFSVAESVMAKTQSS